MHQIEYSKRGIFFMSMPVLKLIHVLFIFIWIGGLLTLTRLLGYLSKENVEVQGRLARICKRIYLFVDLPAMIIAIAAGLYLLFQVQFGASMGWFHMKMTFAVLLVVCDIICGKMIFSINRLGKAPGSKRYKILHSVTALLLIGTLCSIYLVRNKEAEIRARVLTEQSKSS
jgi:putative membrane protein